MGEENERKTITVTNIEITELKAKCDEACKILLADKEIIARILKSTVEEFKNIKIEDIKNIYIEGNPSISQIPVNPDETNARINGENSESTIYGEGTFTFDILFKVIYPDGEDNTFTKLIINLEAQNNYKPGYAIQTRGIYYGCRMISSQYSREFTNSHYENIKKVYSIWVCMEPNKEDINTITTYRIVKENNLGNSKDVPKTYDLLSVLVICLGGEGYDNYDGIVKMLDVLLSTTINAEDKKRVLNEEFGIPMENELGKEIDDMCNISDYYFEKGIEKGISQGISQEREYSIRTLVGLCREFKLTEEEIKKKIVEKFPISAEEAEQKIKACVG